MLGNPMLNRYPDQARTRKGFALVGAAFLCFGAFMLLVESALGAGIGVVLGIALVIPSFTLSHSAFALYERKLSWLSTVGHF